MHSTSQFYEVLPVTFNHLTRRTHLYAGLFFVPWLILYAISSVPFSHARYFADRDKATGRPLWTVRAEIPFDAPVPEGNELRPLGARIVRETGLTGSFGAYRQGRNQVNVYVYTVWRSAQVKYLVDQKKLVVEDRRFRWDQMLTGLHAKGGFEQEDVFNRSWSVLVDLVCLALLVWVGSGVYMWWKLSALRNWGWVAVIGGAATFVGLALML